MSQRVGLALLLVLLAGRVQAQSEAPNAYQVLMYSSTLTNGTVPSINSYNGTPCVLGATTGSPCTAGLLTSPSNYKAIPSIVGLSSALSASIGTALSVIPIASPASGVITETDPVTGADLPANSTLGPIFTERGETIGKHKFYVGLSNQDFHFTSLNGQSLRTLTMLDTGGQTSNVEVTGGVQVKTFPATFDIAADVRLSQNVAFLTYGVTSRFDVSVGFQVAHASISSQTTYGQIYVGDGFNQTPSGATAPLGNCWCVDTFTAGSAPGTASAPNGMGLTLSQSQFNSAKYATTGFGDMLLRFKGTVIQRRNLSLAVGADVRLPTGNAQDFLGTGTVAVKPFLAASLYTKALGHGIVLAPDLNVGWQIAGQSILGGQITATPLTSSTPTEYGPPFVTSKGYLPDVFSWAVGTEVALGRHHTIVADILGNEIGWLHGIPNTTSQAVADVPLVQSTAGAPTLVTASGLVSAGRVSFGQYSGAFGYKARVFGNLVATFNMLVRFDSNGLTAKAVPLFGLGYTF